MSIETFRISKTNITRLFVGAIVAVGAALVLGFAALWAALASDAIDLGGSRPLSTRARVCPQASPQRRGRLPLLA
jgi:hypothetical protein